MTVFRSRSCRRYRRRQPGRPGPGLPASRPGSARSGSPSRSEPPPRSCCWWSTAWAGSSCRTAVIWRPSWPAWPAGPSPRWCPPPRPRRLTSLTVGVPPAAHGIVGYRVVVRRADRARGAQRAALADRVGRRPALRRSGGLPAASTVPGPPGAGGQQERVRRHRFHRGPPAGRARWPGGRWRPAWRSRCGRCWRRGAVRLRLLRGHRQDRPHPAASGPTTTPS